MMTNNDVLRRIRYTFNFDDSKMMAIFGLTGQDTHNRILCCPHNHYIGQYWVSPLYWSVYTKLVFLWCGHLQTMIFLRLLPVFISFLLLGAHFYRAGHPVLVLISVLMVFCWH